MKHSTGNRKYYPIPVLLLLVLVSSCKEEKSSPAEIDYYFAQSYREGGDFYEKKTAIDTFEFHNDADSLIWKKNIQIGGGECELRIYSNYFRAPMDGDRFCVEIPGYGIIFSSSLSWYSYKKLRSSNDSLNRVFDHALDYALIYAQRNDLYAKMGTRDKSVEHP